MPKPFDLEKAKQGATLVTRDGRPAKFVAYVPECDDVTSVVVSIERRIYSVNSKGEGWCGCGTHDLFLADPPKVKKSHWVALWRRGDFICSCNATTKKKAEDAKVFFPWPTEWTLLAPAVEITWEEEAE